MSQTMTDTMRAMVMMLVAAGLSVAMVACLPGSNSSEDCDPETDDMCVCETDEGEVCDDINDLDCYCSSTMLDEDGDGFPDEDLDPDDDLEPEPASKRFVLIEDMTPRVAGNAPGADLDAISVVKRNGGEFFATALEDFEIGMGENLYSNPEEVLGAPDSDCEKKSFVSLGGAEAGGYVMVSFATSSQDVTVEAGDSIKIYELGSTLCPSTNYDDDPYNVSVSVSTDLGTFVEVGAGGEGRNVIPIAF